MRRGDGRRAVLAQRHRGAGALDQDPGLPAERARAAAEGCAAVEPEADLVEEVLRIRGLDTGPRRLAAGGRHRPAAGADAEAGPRRCWRGACWRRAACWIASASASSSRSRRRCSAKRRTRCAWSTRSPPTSTRCGPTPVASLLLAAGRNAARGWPDVALAELGAACATRRPPGSSGRRRHPRRPHAAALGGAVPRRRCHGCQGRCAGGAGRARRADGGGDGHRRCAGLLPPGPQRRAAAGAEDGAGDLRRDPPEGPRRARPGRAGGGVRGLPRRHPRAQAPQEGRARTCRPSSRCGATSPSWWMPR